MRRNRKSIPRRTKTVQRGTHRRIDRGTPLVRAYVQKRLKKSLSLRKFCADPRAATRGTESEPIHQLPRAFLRDSRNLRRTFAIRAPPPRDGGLRRSGNVAFYSITGTTVPEEVSSRESSKVATKVQAVKTIVRVMAG